MQNTGEILPLGILGFRSWADGGAGEEESVPTSPLLLYMRAGLPGESLCCADASRAEFTPSVRGYGQFSGHSCKV